MMLASTIIIAVRFMQKLPPIDQIGNSQSSHLVLDYSGYTTCIPMMYACLASSKLILFAPPLKSGFLSWTGSFSHPQTLQMSYSPTFVFPQHGHFILFVSFKFISPILELIWWFESCARSSIMPLCFICFCTKQRPRIFQSGSMYHIISRIGLPITINLSSTSSLVWTRSSLFGP